MTTPDPRLRAAIATAIAALGIHTAPGWVDAVVALLWLAGGIVDYVWTRDRDRDGRPDGPQIVARTLGWSEVDTLTALQELRRIGPSAIVWLRRIGSASVLALLVGCGATQDPGIAWKVLQAACRLVESVPNDR